ncbi:hypothetical protein [Psychrobacter pygoscelis]|uniref:hypothetical protein n=1 Tax=Psychrobacter pygoscelis TaxID=2488563 RepID=UPI00103F7AAF|nr:hypothetical protein [Psychrobacter pygoscelis]
MGKIRVEQDNNFNLSLCLENLNGRCADIIVGDGYDHINIEVDKWPEVKAAIDKLIAERGKPPEMTHFERTGVLIDPL